MELNPQVATTIVTNLKDIIPHQINLFDMNGVIIASTDESRIGTSHEGAKIVALTNETLTIERDNQFEGAKKGINIPVVFDQSVVATIGITGERTEVEPYGNIIKKMTEILIRENWVQMTHFNQRISYNNLVHLLKSKNRDENLASYLSSLLELDLKCKRFVVVGKLLDHKEQAIFDYENLLPFINTRFQAYDSIFFSLANNELCIFVEEKDSKLITNLLNSLQNDIYLKFKRHFSFGIGSITSYSEYRSSYLEAKKTVDWLIYKNEAGIELFKNLDYGLFLDLIPKKDATQLLNKVFHHMKEKDIEQFEEIFDTYTLYNGSILKCSEALFIHKNTFQNKLDKLTKKTGYNPRKLQDFTILSIAFYLRKIMKYNEINLNE